MKIKIFNFFSKITTACKIWSQKFRSFLIVKIFFFVYMNSRKNSGGIDVSFVSQLENNDTSENKETTVYCNIYAA